MKPNVLGVTTTCLKSRLLFTENKSLVGVMITRLERFLLDCLVVKDDLSQFVLVVRWFRLSHELAWVFLVGFACLLEVAPVGQDLADRLLGCLGVVEILEAVFALRLLNEPVDVGQR